MTPLRPIGTTRVLGAPPTWDEATHGPCDGLPVVDSAGMMFSYWKPSWRERWAILRGTPVRLCVAGTVGHPAVALEATRD